MSTWHNFRTGQAEAGEPKDWHDVIPQDRASQDTFDTMIAMGFKPLEVVEAILEAHIEITNNEYKHGLN